MGAKSRAKAERRAAARVEAATDDARKRAWWAGGVLFVVALLLRILFWQATPDRSWPYSAWYKGDAPVWMEYASALQAGREFELGLPIHPPGAGYLVAALWNGRPSGVVWLRFVWAVMGALLVVLVYAAVRRSFGLTAAVIAGYLCAVSSGLMVLGSAVNNEVPYLLLFVCSLVLWDDAVAGASSWRLAVFAALQGIACLFRVEHVLCVALLLGLLAFAWARRSGVALMAARLGVALTAFALPLVPWHLVAWRGIERFNDGPRVFEPGEDAAIAQVERALSRLPVRADAVRRRDELPAFLRRPASVFVAATVAHRGGREVRAEDFAILEEAFGYIPRPLARHPFVSSYGPLNFYLANRHGAPAGFDRSPLDQPPPLAGGRERYPAFLVQGLPPPDLAFVYPPHLRLFNEGARLGWQAIRERPGEWLARAAGKLRVFWGGAALGATGWNAPFGLSGVRRAVDLVVPDGALATAWSVLLLLACAVGLFAGRRWIALAPWLAFLASKVVTTVLFFGYARQGAVLIPVVALLVALALEHWASPLAARWPARTRHVAAALLLAAPVLAEGVRWAAGPQIAIDGQVIRASDPFPAHEHRDQVIRVRAD